MPYYRAITTRTYHHLFYTVDQENAQIFYENLDDFEEETEHGWQGNEETITWVQLPDDYDPDKQQPTPVNIIGGDEE